MKQGSIRRAATVAVTLLAMISLMATSQRPDPDRYSRGTTVPGDTDLSAGSTLPGGTGSGTSRRSTTTVRSAIRFFGVGDPVRLGTWTVVVESIEDPYRPTNRRPARGRYLALDLVVTNNGELAETISLRDCFELRDDSGWATNLAPAEKSELGGLDGEVPPKGQRMGRVLADVPDDADHLELHFTCDLLSQGRAAVRIE